MRRPHWISSGALLALAIGVAGEAGAEPVVSRLRIGATRAEVEQTLRERGVRFSHRSATAPQAMAVGLLESGLLGAMNRARATPKSRDGTFNAEPLSHFIVSAPKNAKTQVGYAVALDRSGRARFVLASIPVPVDRSRDAPGAWHPDRLRRLKDALAAMGAFRLRATKRDARRNAFAWRGRHPRGGRISVFYEPAEDRLQVLLHD